MAEAVYVPKGYHKASRLKIAEAMRLFSEEGNVHMHEPLSVVMNALRLYAEISLDYVDGSLFAQRALWGV